MTHAAFSGFDQLASGSLAEVYAACRHDPSALIFDQETGRVVDVDPRFPPSEEGPKPGRPKLGVVAREVTLLPRHWDWLATQPGGASVALRKLVEAARNVKRPQDLVRGAQEAAYRFMTAMAGNLAGYEDAIRALYARDRERFGALTTGWPADIRDHAQRLAEAALAETSG